MEIKEKEISILMTHQLPILLPLYQAKTEEHYQDYTNNLHTKAGTVSVTGPEYTTFYYKVQ